jgi:LmbE family N-acetylglucosaminyl deacetylase
VTPRDLTGPGTAESRWLSSSLFAALPRVGPSQRRPPGRAVVLAPHPDDETLGVGGTLAAWAADGVEILVVAVTDGEGSHPDSPTLTPEELAARRHDERRAALAELGCGAASVLRAGLPDSDVGRHRDALREYLLRVVVPGDTVLAPVLGDGHPDHDAVADVAREAATCRGAAVWHYAVWLWHWADPDEPSIPGDGAVAVALPDRARRAKQAAVACFTTQIEPLSDDPRDAAVLPPPVLARLTREVEVLWTSP